MPRGGFLGGRMPAGWAEGLGGGSSGGEPPEGSALLTLAVYEARVEGGPRLGRAAARDRGRQVGRTVGSTAVRQTGRQALVNGLSLGWATLQCRLAWQRQRQPHPTLTYPYILNSLMPTAEPRVDLA